MDKTERLATGRPIVLTVVGGLNLQASEVVSVVLPRVKSQGGFVYLQIIAVSRQIDQRKPDTKPWRCIDQLRQSWRYSQPTQQADQPPGFVSLYCVHGRPQVFFSFRISLA